MYTSFDLNNGLIYTKGNQFTSFTRPDQKKPSASIRHPDQDLDLLEISDEARKKLEEGQGSLLQPAKTLQLGSQEHEKFQILMDTVKKQKSEITASIEDALQKGGISLANAGKLKIEIDGSGKIVAGGIEDKRVAAAVERALNRDKSLAGRIAEYQKNEKDLSGRIKDYTGCTLYELTMTRRGDVSERIREEVGMQGNIDYYMGLGFLGSTRDIVNADDVTVLSFNGNIDFSGEIDVMANPEGNIRQTMDEMYKKVREAFDAINAEVLKRMEEDGVKVDEKTARFLLDARKASITVDNRGGVTIEGQLSEDGELHERGMKVLEKLVREMLAETEGNSYHVNIFMASSLNLALREGEGRGESGEVDRGVRVVAKMIGGVVRDIRLERSSADKMPTSIREQADKLQGSIDKTMSGVARHV